MCKVTKGKLYSVMDGDKFQEKYHGLFSKCSSLLGLAVADDVAGFIDMVKEKGVSVDEVSFWYGRRNGGDKRKLGLEEQTPLMIASIYESIQVLKYIIPSNKIDANKSFGSNGATTLHCAASGGSPMVVEVVKLLLEASTDVNLTDNNGNKVSDVIARGIRSSTRRDLEILLKGFSVEDGSMKNKSKRKKLCQRRKNTRFMCRCRILTTMCMGSMSFEIHV